jgi:hypothetical protein
VRELAAIDCQSTRPDKPLIERALAMDVPAAQVASRAISVAERGTAPSCNS